MNPKAKFAVSVAAMLVLGGCIKKVPYLPNTTVADAQAQIEKIITTNAGIGVTRVDFKPGYFTVASVSVYGPYQQSIRYDLVKKIEIYRRGSVHQVQVSNADDDQIFAWGVNGVEDAQALADAIASEVSSQTSAGK